MLSLSLDLKCASFSWAGELQTKAINLVEGKIVLLLTILSSYEIEAAQGSSTVKPYAGIKVETTGAPQQPVN